MQQPSRAFQSHGALHDTVQICQQHDGTLVWFLMRGLMLQTLMFQTKPGLLEPIKCIPPASKYVIKHSGARASFPLLNIQCEPSRCAFSFITAVNAGLCVALL